MSPPPSTPTPRRRLRRLLRVVGIVLLVGVASLALAYETRERWLGPYLAERLSSELSRATGAQVRVAALGGNWLRTLELREISWRDGRAKAELRELDVRLARVHWNPWALVRRRPDWLTSVEFEVEGLRARAHLGAKEGGEPSGVERSGGEVDLPRWLPTVRVRAADLELELDAGVLALRGARLELGSLDHGRQPVHVAAREIAWRPIEGSPLAAAFEAELAWAAPRLEVGTLRLDGVERASDSWVDLGAVGRGDVEWDARVSAFEGLVHTRGAWRAGALETEVELGTVALAPALRLLVPGLADPPAAVLDGRGSVRLVGGEPESLRADFAGRASQVRVLGRDVQVVEGEVALEDNVLLFRRLLVSRGTGRLSATDVSLPLGRGGLQTLRGARGSVELVATDLPAWFGTPPPPGSMASRAPAHVLEVTARLTAEGLALERGRLTTAGGRFLVRPSSIAWSSSERLLDAVRLDLDLDLDFDDLSDVGEVLAMPGRWSGSLRGGLRLEGTPDALVGSLDVEGLDVVAADVELGELRTIADVDAERIRIEDFRATGPLGELSLQGAWNLSEGRFEDARLSAATVASELVLPGVFERGAIELEADLSGPPHDPRGRFRARALDLVIAALPDGAIEDLTIEGRLEEGQVVLEELALDTEGVSVRAAGSVSHTAWQAPLELRLDALSASREGLDLELLHSARVAYDGVSFSTEELLLSGSAGDLELELMGGGGDLSVRLQAQRLDPMPLLVTLAPAGFLVEGIQGSASLELSGGVLTATAALEVERLIPAQGLPQLRLVARGTLADGRAKLERLMLEADSSRRLELSGEAPFDPLGEQLLPAGPLALEGRFEIADLTSLPLTLGQAQLALAGALGVSFDLRGEWARVLGSAQVTGEDVALVSRNGTAMFGPARLSALVECGEQETRLSEILLQAPGQADFTGQGTLGVALAPERWMADDTLDLLEAPLALQLRLAAADLAFVARLLPGVRRVSGRIDGDLQVTGTLARPLPRAHVELTEGELRLSGDVPSFDALRAVLELEPERLTLVRLAGEMGGGSLSGEGELDWSGAEPIVELTLQGDEVLIVQQPDLRVRSDAELSVRGPLTEMEVSGRLALREGRYTKRVELFKRESGPRAAPGPPITLFSFDEGALASMRFDVAVASDEPFRIENNLVRGSVRADLRLAGTGRSPELLGALFVDPTVVALPATVLETTSGTLLFEREDPLMPALDVRMETRVRGYDVAVRATGSLGDPQLELTSIPPLPSEDLLVLVLTGKPPELSWDARTGERAAQTVAFYVGKDLLQDWFSTPGSGRGESWLERIEWRTGVDVTESGEETSELSFRISGSGRGAGRTVWLRAENDAYDRVNYGVRLLFRLK